MSVTLLHHAKAVAWKEMPFSKDTPVVPSNTVLDRGPGTPREGEIWGRNPREKEGKGRESLFHHNKHMNNM